MRRKTSGVAIAAFILGMIFPFAVTNILYGVPSFNKTISFVLMLSPFAGVLLGHTAKSQIRRAKGEIRGLAFANIGLALSYAQVLLFVVGLLIYRVERFPIPAYESSAVGSLRTLNFAVHAYAKAHRQEGFPEKIEDLVRNGSRMDDDWAIDQVLASGVKANYRFTYVPRSIKGDKAIDAYQIFADPIDLKEKTFRHFFTDQTESIRMSAGAPANEKSTELK